MAHAQSTPRRFQTLLEAYRTRLLWLFVGVVLPLVVFGLLARQIATGTNFSWDDRVLLWVHGWATPTFNLIMIALAYIGYMYGVVPVGIAIFFLLVYRRRRRDALFWATSQLGALLINVTVKALFHRVRPALWQSVLPEHSFSFPSGHASASMAMMVALVVLLWPTRWRWPMLIFGAVFVALIGLCRLYLGVHYPSDVLAGWLSGLAWVTGVSTIFYGRVGKPAGPAPEPLPAS